MILSWGAQRSSRHALSTQSGATIDFVTTHTYGVDGGFLDQDGKEDIKLSPSPDAIVGEVRKVRQQIKASKFPDLPLYSVGDSGSYVFSLPMRSNDVVLVTLERIKKSRSPNRPVGGTQP